MRVAASTIAPPIPRCPPPQLFRERAYQAKLDKMSLGALRKEKAQIQNRMSVGRWTPEGYELIKAKLELVVKEIKSRGSKVPVAFDAVG